MQTPRAKSAVAVGSETVKDSSFLSPTSISLHVHLFIFTRKPFVMWALLFSSILQRSRRNQRRPRNPLRRHSSSTMQRDRHPGTLDLLHRSFLGELVVAAGSSSVVAGRVVVVDRNLVDRNLVDRNLADRRPVVVVAAHILAVAVVVGSLGAHRYSSLGPTF